MQFASNDLVLSSHRHDVDRGTEHLERRRAVAERAAEGDEEDASGRGRLGIHFAFRRPARLAHR